jgi:hypothetical protein
MNDLDGYLPISLFRYAGKGVIRWCYFGDSALKAPFFKDDVDFHLHSETAKNRHTSIHEILNVAHESDCVYPNGFIFHMSRCGSTLLTNMLKKKHGCQVFSEPSFLIDILVEANEANEDYILELFRAAVLTLGRKRTGEEKHFVIKFYSAAIFALPLITKAFPDVPAVFMYRDPVEVLVSNMEDPNQMWMYHPPTLGLTHSAVTEENTLLENCALALRKKLEGFIPFISDRHRLLNYKSLTKECLASILDLFSIAYTEEELQAMYDAKKLNSKKQAEKFNDDSAQKNNQASERLKQIAREVLYPVYNELEKFRTAESEKIVIKS